jgi:ABC-type transport system involved in multi-copper enzyme maturation permease subunit
MSVASALLTTRWLARDTFLQSMTSGVFWFMVAVSVATSLFCLTAAPPADGSDSLEVAFGAIHVDASHGLPAAVRTLEVHLAGWVADVAGLLLALIWTAGFLPTFLEPAAASVLLAKPAPRWLLLVGKLLGVLAFVAVQGFLFVGGTWLALGVRTGVWDAVYFLCVPLLLIHFAVFYSFSAMLAVATRSTVACVFGSVAFWGLCWGMNFGRHAIHILPEIQGLSGVLAAAADVSYWVLPKPLDFQLLLSDMLRPGELFGRLVSTPKLDAYGAWSPVASVLASVTAAVVLFAVAAYDFATADY